MAATDETSALEHLLDRMRARYPDVPVDRLRSIIIDVHHEYDGRPIREFIPVLVERDVRERLGSGQALPEQQSRAAGGRVRPRENA